jgi:type IV pilus assembly protein PilE
MKKAKGFTLIELVVAMVIIGILASIAFPSYREYVIRGNRRAAQAAMMEIATREQQYFVANRVYAAVTKDKATDELGFSLPDAVGDHYDYWVTVTAGAPPTFTITFEPKGTQSGDGNLTLTSAGVKGPAEKWKR